MFHRSAINIPLLKQRAFNLRWAEVHEGVIPLTAADPDFPCAPPIIEAISKYTADGYFSYASPRGHLPFREALHAYYAQHRSAVFAVDQILPVDSAAFGIHLVCQTFLQPGDEAVIFDPVDFLFGYAVAQAGAKAVAFPIPPGTSHVDFAAMEALITPNTKLICLCNPLNPTGKVFSSKELSALGAIAVKHNLLILSDEIWSDIVFAPHLFTSMASMHEDICKRTITVTGFSKSYGLAGLRVGAVLTQNADLFDALYACSKHGTTVHGANILGQVAATAALNECQEWLQQFVAHLQHMRNLTVNELNHTKGFSCIAPEGCYVAFANIRGTGMTSAEVHQHILSNAAVAVVPGLPQWFGAGAEGYIRICFATAEAILSEALGNIKKSFS